MTWEAYMAHLVKIEEKISECRHAPPGDSEMIRGDIRELFNLVSRLESDSR